jgi:hypothetical protein
MRISSLTVAISLLACSLLAVLAGAQEAAVDVRGDPFALPAVSPTQPAQSLLVDKEAIARAVRETLAENPEPASPMSGTALSGTSAGYTRFARQFAQAEKPHCLGPDPMKHQPASRVVRTVFGDFVVGVAGPFALPFWGAAILRGKCSWRR